MIPSIVVAMAGLSARKKPPAGTRGGNVTKRNGIARRFAGGPAASKEVKRRLRDAERIAKRRHRAWQLYVGGVDGDELSYIDVGKILGISNKTAWEDVMHVYRSFEAMEMGNSEMIRSRQQAIVNALRRAHWPKRDQVAHARIILDGLDREAKLHGIDRQKAAYSEEQMAAVVRACWTTFLAVVKDDEQRRLFSAGLKRIAPTVIEAEAVAPITPALAPEESGVGDI